MTIAELIEELGKQDDPTREILIPSALYVADEFGNDAPTKTYIRCFEDMTAERKEVLRLDYNRIAVKDIENSFIIDMEE